LKAKEEIMPNEPMTPEYWTLYKLFENTFSIPVYQRPYSWEKEQISGLLNDLFDTFEKFQTSNDNDRDSVSLYLGNIILHLKTSRKFDVIDGQQRITTFTLFYMALYSRLMELGADKNNTNVIKLRESLWKTNSQGEIDYSKPAVTLGSVEKGIFNSVYLLASSSPEKLFSDVEKLKISSKYEENVKNNFLDIYKYLVSELGDVVSSYLEFSKFVLFNVYVISITTSIKTNRAFEVFESINSKGKRLDDIDLIKTVIFSKLADDEYVSYLDKWGRLILETNDGLYDYLKNYIRAFITFYTINIRYANFISLTNTFINHFKTTNIADAYKKMIDDMIEKLDFYKSLYDLKAASLIIGDKKFKFYYQVYLKNRYEYLRGIFIRLFSDTKNNIVSQEDAVSIVKNLVISMISFSIMNVESKNTIILFKEIYDDIYKSGVSLNAILYRINNYNLSNGISPVRLEQRMEEFDAYEKNKTTGLYFSCVYENSYKDKKDELIVSWDSAFADYSAFGASLSLDHILNQTPKSSDPLLKYYEENKFLVLKEGSDFPSKFTSGSDYSAFKTAILNQCGNLRLMGLDENISRGNTSDENFNDYKGLINRTKEMAKFVIEKSLIVDDVDPKYVPVSNNNNNEPLQLVLSDQFDMTFLRIVQLIINDYNNNLPIEIKNNYSIVGSIIEYLNTVDSEKIQRLAFSAWGLKESKRPIITVKENSSSLREPHETTCGVIYEGNLNSNSIIKVCRQLLDEFSINQSNITIVVKK